MNREIARRKAQSEYGVLRWKSQQLSNFLALLPTMTVTNMTAARQEIYTELNKIHSKMGQLKKQLRY